MEMINSKSLFYLAHYVLKQIHLIDSAKSCAGIKETIQQFTIANQKFDLVVIVKPFEPHGSKTLLISETVNQEYLIHAAHELVTAAPRPIGHECFKKDVQQFTDTNKGKFILSLVFSCNWRTIP